MVQVKKRGRMQIIWEVEPQDVARVHTFFRAYEAGPFVQERRRRNLATTKPSLDKVVVWEALVGCLLTTQQRSGPNSAISRFMGERPFPLGYDLCQSRENLEKWVQKTVTNFGGIRRANILGGEIQVNFTHLEAGLWPELLQQLDALRQPHDATHERAAAEFIRTNFKGFGPKQSRNLLQWLGLSLYEIPLDSRIAKWLNAFGFPVQLSAAALSDPSYYNLISDGFQQLCAQSDLVPCLLDAAIFTSFDNDGWTTENIVG